MGNAQCQKDCKIDDFRIKILQQTVNARTNYTKTVEGNSVRTTYPAESGINQLYILDWINDEITREGFIKHAHVKLSINEDGKVDQYFEKDTNRDTLIETSQEGYTTATGYKLGDELKISKTDAPSGSDIAQSTGDFEFRLIPKHPSQSSINYTWLCLVLFLIMLVVIVFLGDKNNKVMYGTLWTVALYPLVIAICFMVRNEEKNLEEFDGASYPHTVHEKWTLVIPALPFLIGAGLELRSMMKVLPSV